MIKITERTDGRRRVQLITEGESKVEQSHRDMCNINTIVAKAKRTGRLPIHEQGLKYGNFITGKTYHDICNAKAMAEQDFMKLPAELRKRFGNNVGALIDFLGNPENVEEAVQLGFYPPSILEGRPAKNASTEATAEPETPVNETDQPKKEPTE